ncbi:MAG: AmmeMemoRadiSam system radical SAM enzyme, partial [Candidatus Diapherotrites archaeon]|nr:AmmeMemoRadiSam system radical SAM enzyme [Candidatus Diapherotrites archaeon]
QRLSFPKERPWGRKKGGAVAPVVVCMKEAMLYSKLKDKQVKCNLCMRQCTIPDGALGFCRARKNRNGVLYSEVYGKACTVAVDPIEKKPFFHFLPGTDALSIATTGCNFRCKHCFTPDTFVVTSKGAHEIGELFNLEDTDVLTHRGDMRSVVKRFKHQYDGGIIEIKPRFLPKIQCTPDHRFFAVKDGKLEKTEAKCLVKGDLLPLPKRRHGTQKELDIHRILNKIKAPSVKVHRRVNKALLEQMKRLRGEGLSSTQIGESINMNPAYVRTVFSRLNRFGEKVLLRETIEGALMNSCGKVRFKYENGMIPSSVPVLPALGRLMGLYCAEGSVSKHPSRPNSYVLRLSFGLHEDELANDAKRLLEEIFGVKAVIRKYATTLVVHVYSTSLAILFALLCGKGSKNKRVPAFVFQSPKNVVGAFLQGYLDGDGCYKKTHTDAITVSRRLAMGVSELLLMQGVLPGVYTHKPPSEKKLLGRNVKQSTEYIVRFPAGFDFIAGKWVRQKAKQFYTEDEHYYYVPVMAVSKRYYSGPVFNLEVNMDHSYTANFVAVCNCQNWTISQACVEDVPYTELPPKGVVDAALQHNCPSIAYTYTEPTIFFEYAYDTSKLAVKKGLKNLFVTNGYMTPEMLKTYGKLLHAANVDVKGNDRFYKEVCFAELQPVLDNIKRMHKAGVHVEVTTLVIPGFNDDDDSIRMIADFVKGVDPSIPLHLTAFYPQYLLTDVPTTPRETLVRARSIALEEGVRYVYVGNILPGDSSENTYCHACGYLLVKRHGFAVAAVNLIDGKCPNCSAKANFVLE